MALIWRPAVASASVGWSATPDTTHVNATAGGPTFTVAGPTRGVRFRSPDFGAPASLAGDSAIHFTMSTTQTGLVTSSAGWAPAIPLFPAAASPGPFVKNQSGITITLNSDGKRAQNGGGALGYRLAKQNSNPPASPEHEWITFEFSSPVTNIIFGGSFFTAAGPTPREGMSQLEVLFETEDSNLECCCPLNLDSRCYVVEELQALFDTVVVTANPAGYALAGPIGRFIDQDITGALFTGFFTPAGQISDANSPTIEFTFTTPQNRVTRVQEYNQGGGDLGDFDGFASTLLQVFDPTNALLFSGTFTMGNGGSPFQLIFPTPLNNVKRMTWTLVKKLNPGATVAPLAREFQAFREPVRHAVASICDGTITWFDAETGDVVSLLNFIDCS